MSERICSIDGCGGRTGQSGTARGLCSTHYRSWRETGEPKPQQAACRWCTGELVGAPVTGTYCSSTCARAAAVVPDASKRCRDCDEEKPYSAFQRKAAAPDGFAYVCRDCDSAKRIQRRINKGERRPDPQAGHKWCSRCETEKPLTEFYARLSGPQAGKPYAYCIPCVRADHTARARANGVLPKPEPDPLRAWRWRLATYYGLTVEDYQRILAAQDGRCCGCGLAEDESEQHFCVDHDHVCCAGDTSCGQCVRGLLCSGCNFAVGHARDSPHVLRSLADYLERAVQVAVRPAS